MSQAWNGDALLHADDRRDGRADRQVAGGRGCAQADPAGAVEIEGIVRRPALDQQWNGCGREVLDVKLVRPAAVDVVGAQLPVGRGEAGGG
jgi:hypothetical protein